jgi:hypothetical protein
LKLLKLFNTYIYKPLFKAVQTIEILLKDEKILIKKLKEESERNVYLKKCLSNLLALI